MAEEVHDSQRTLPRALLLGCLLVTVLYVLANVAYLAVLPVDQIAAVPENRVAERVAVVLFGRVGSTLVIAAILVSTFGCLNGLILGGARVCYAMAREGLFFRHCARLHAREYARRGPALPGRLVDGACAVGLVLRIADLQHVRLGPVRRPDGGRRLPLAIFAAGAAAARIAAGATLSRRPCTWRFALAFLVYVIRGDPQATVLGLLLLLTGVPFYVMWKAQAAKRAG